VERSVKMDSLRVTHRQLLVSHRSFIPFGSVCCVAFLSWMRKAADGLWLAACF